MPDSDRSRKCDTETGRACPHCGGRSFRHGEAAALDVERLARAIATVAGDGHVFDADREQAAALANEYARLAAEPSERGAP